MHYRPECFSLSLCMLVCLASLGFAQAPPQDAPSGTVRVEANEVLLDLIARDKKGKTVRDLRPEEIEVYEDGVKQQVSAFRFIGTETDAGETVVKANDVSPPTTTTTADPFRQMKLVTLVFDTLGLEGRRLSQQAALDYLKNQLQPNVFVAVFKVDRRLYVLQEFTSDRKKIEQAVERATKGSYTEFAEMSGRIRRQLEDYRRLQREAAADPLGRGQTNPVQNLEMLRARIILNAMQFEEGLQRDQQGHASIASLLAIVREQRALAGRKTLVYFAEGLQVPPTMTELFRTAISEANRANVSIYSVDARGLSSTRMLSAGQDLLEQAVAGSTLTLSRSGGEAVTREEVMAADMAETSVTRDDQGAMGDLAAGTGGFLTANSNNLRSGMRRMAADIGAYYAVSYVPRLRQYDGKFHGITVKVSRPNVKLQTRKGYFAVPPTEGRPVLPFEMPLLAALGRSDEPSADAAYRVAIFRFAQNAETIEHQLVVEVPLRNFTFAPDADKKTHHTKFAMMALVKDASGRIVRRFSQNFPLAFPAERAAGAKNRNVLFLRNFDLAPGRYMLETIAYDFETDRPLVRRRELNVAGTKPGIAVSDLIVIKRVEPIADFAAATIAEGESRDPLRYHAAKIVPLLDAPVITAGQKGGLPLYFLLYPAPASAPPASLTLEFRRDNELIGHNSPELPAPNKDGLIPYVVTIPTDTFRPGRFEVKAVVKQGEALAEGLISFTVNPPPGGEAELSREKTNGTSQVVTANFAPEANPATLPADLESEQSAYLANVSRELLPAPNSAEALEILRLLGESEDRGAAMHQKVVAYTYQLKKTRRELNEKGKVKKEDVDEFEAYPVRGQHQLVQTRKSGKPQPSQLVTIERRSVGLELEKIEKEDRRRDETRANGARQIASPWDGYIRAGVEATSTKTAKITIDVSEFLRSCQFYKLRREKLGDREAFALDFIPRPNANLPENKAYLAKLIGTVWLDAADKAVVRLEGWPAPAFEKAAGRKGLPPRTAPALVYQQTRMPNGIWLPSLIRMNAAGNPLLFAGVNWDVLFEMSDYKLFDSTVDRAEVGQD